MCHRRTIILRQLHRALRTESNEFDYLWAYIKEWIAKEIALTWQAQLWFPLDISHLLSLSFLHYGQPSIVCCGFPAVSSRMGCVICTIVCVDAEYHTFVDPLRLFSTIAVGTALTCFSRAEQPSGPLDVTLDPLIIQRLQVSMENGHFTDKGGPLCLVAVPKILQLESASYFPRLKKVKYRPTLQ